MKQDPQTQIIEKLDALSGKVDKMVPRDEFREEMGKMVTRDEFNTTMDEVLTIVRRLDQERIFTLEWVRRIEADVERVKKHLHLV